MKDAPINLPPAENIHSCSYYCQRPECIKRQRDELVKRMEADPVQQEPVAWMHDAHISGPADQRPCVADGSKRGMPKAVASGYSIPLYTHPDADLRAELADAKQDLRDEVAFRHEEVAKWSKVVDDALAVADRAEAERDALTVELSKGPTLYAYTAMRTERDSLRALLQEARACIWPSSTTHEQIRDRIDAALKRTPNE